MQKLGQRWKASAGWIAACAVLAGIVLSATLHAGLGEVEAPRIEPAWQPAAAELASSEPISPLPVALALDPRRVALGNRLFHDPQLSGDNQMSCASCHHNSLGGADGLPRSLGRDGTPLNFNSPTVWNSGFNFRQFWDGRAATLEAQVDEPILHPNEMNSSWPEIIAKLEKQDDYLRTFRALYEAGLQPESIRNAIATYERSLITPNAKFDRYLRGDRAALTATEKRGYDLFKAYGCAACHQGVNIGGNMYQRLGIMADYFIDRGNIQTADKGRMNITGRVRDRYVFKVPSLRNVELTAPYLHDGSVGTLEAVTRLMATYQLGREIPEDDVTAIVQFLTTLTGELAPLPDASPDASTQL